MSLRVWLPLNGTLDNQGLDNITTTLSGGIAIDNSGKIGKCYNFDGTNGQLLLTNLDLRGLPQVSFAFWCCPVEDLTGLFQISVGGTHRVQIGTSTLSFRDSNNSTLRNVSYNTTFIPNTWVHMVCIYNRGQITIYVNGIQTNHNTTYYHDNSVFYSDLNQYRIGRIRVSSGDVYYNGKLNDFRIYDHALSAMEVKQLSQGLILHYPLNNNGWGNENLLTNSTTEKTGYSNVTQWFRWNISPSPLIANQYYTLSFDAKMSVPTDVFYIGWAKSDSTQQIFKQQVQVTSEYKHYTFSGKTTKTNVNSILISNYKGYNRGNENNTTGLLSVKNVRLRIGIIDDDTEYDCSGYQRNGIKNGSFLYESDTPKYNASSVFNGEDTFINIGNQLHNARDEVTVNFWIKTDSWATNPGTFFSGVEAGGYGWQIRKSTQDYNVYCGIGVSSNSYKSSRFNTSSLDSSKWHMITLTYDGFVLKTYIDTVSTTTSAENSVKTPLFFNSNAGMFIGGEASTDPNVPSTEQQYRRFEGKISDFRVYCTALSPQDIISLYHNEAYIDNNGNIYGAILRED